MLAHHASRVIGVSRSLVVALKRDDVADAALLLGRKHRSDRRLDRYYKFTVIREDLVRWIGEERNPPLASTAAQEA